ncbi:MAG TPA: HrcA family transcriptional regulator, partial [Thermodesulfovibrionales bacterium]|nr:HrcA family transcriptional regulator [Thermodesulfovibrionales bacterium]
MIEERAYKVLWAVVDSYITHPDPVGSRYITKKYAFNLSPATIRNIMADLEEMGFLLQPHTSAGRIPTDKGYRLYVDHLARTRG